MENPLHPPYGDIISEWPIGKLPYGIVKEMAGRGDEEAAAEMRRREKAAAKRSRTPPEN